MPYLSLNLNRIPQTLRSALITLGLDLLNLFGYIIITVLSITILFDTYVLKGSWCTLCLAE